MSNNEDPFLKELDNLPDDHPALALLEGATSVTKEKMADIGPLVQKWYEGKSSVKLLEDQLKAAKDSLEKLETDTLPNALRSAGLKEITLDSGEKVTIVGEVFASIPAAKQEEAFAWFQENDFGDLLRNDIKLGFGKGQDENADSVEELLQGEGIPYERKRNIHWKTLQSFVVGELEAGRELPPSISWHRKDRIKVKA